MDLSLKQRLLGAAVLIALAVIFVPMFMSGSSTPQKAAEMETSTLAIPPAPDHEFQTRELPVEPPKPAAPTSATAADDGRVATVDTATAPKSEPESAPAATPTEAPPSSASAPPATPVRTEAPPKTTAKPAPAPPAAPTRTEAPAKTPAKLASATPVATEPAKPMPGQAANGRYFVHLGVYTTSKNADDLVASLKTGGFPAFAEASEFQGKPASRVRVGPFDNRAAAEAARLRIKQIKPAVPGSVIETAEDAKADASVAALPANRAGGWAVQLGALKTVEEANKLRDRLKGAGFAAFVDKANVNGSTLWRVRVGPETDRGAADKLRASIKEKLKLDGVLVTQS